MYTELKEKMVKEDINGIKRTWLEGEDGMGARFFFFTYGAFDNKELL